MRLNMYVEYLPGQEGQVSDFSLKLAEAIRDKKVDATVITDSDSTHASHLLMAESLLHRNDQLRSEHVTGLILWTGTLLSQFARASEHHNLDEYRLGMAVSQMAAIVKAVVTMGMPTPAVVVIPKRPTEKTYAKLVDENCPVSNGHSVKRWWKNGAAFLTEATLLSSRWCDTHPEIIAVDYGDTDAAVAKVMKNLPSNIWDDYHNGSGVHLTDKEHFMGLSPLEVKVPKKYLTHIVYEAASKNISLDSHVSAIFKKYLLADIRRPHTE